MQPSVHQRINSRAAEYRRRVTYPGADRSLSLARYGHSIKAREAGSVGRSHDGRRWIEHAIRLGLRVAGLAHELATMRHTGWHTDPDGNGELMRGVVLRLPAKAGRNRYLIGRDDPRNDDCFVVLDELQDALRKAEDECHELDCAGIRLGHVYLREQRCRIWIGRFPRGQEMSTRQVI